MQKFALAAIALPMMAAPAMAGPYVMTKSEFKGANDNYSGAVNQARLGYEGKVGILAPYVEVGGGLVTPDGGDSDGLLAVEVGTGIKLTEKLSAKAKFENIRVNSNDSWKVEVGTKYKF